MPALICFSMIILQINNWDSVEIFRLNTNDSLIDAIQGIPLSPFAHSSNKHLINNVVPLFFLMSLLRYIFDKFSSMKDKAPVSSPILIIETNNRGMTFAVIKEELSSWP